jgi:putative Mn2+ efflux pump MntP
MGILTWIIVAIIILAIIGLGWDNFFAGVKKGADKIRITSILENATNSATDIARNASIDIIDNSLGK